MAYILADHGATDWCIAIGRQASPSENHGAEELQTFLKQISGATLPIVRDNAPISPHEILLGESKHLDQLGLEIDWKRLGDEGFVIRTIGDHLVIAGGKLRGTLYGVYTFLEEHLGCRWFSSKVSYAPQQKRIKIGAIDEEQIPVLEYREPYYTDAFDGDWAARNRMNSSSADLEAKHGGKVIYSHFVHTFYALLPPEEYFAEHPEYYSEMDGKRTVERAQLCLTNPDVVRITTDKVRQWIQEQPDARIISVSQNDWHGACECKACRAIDEREGSPIGSLLLFVNQIAGAIARDYPDVAIDTLAYQYTRKPPKTIRPRDNVIVRLCSIECCFSHPLESCLENASFVEDIRAWSQICERLYIWDYVTDFAHYLLPFPNLDVLKPNIAFFVQHHVKGIFEEGNYALGGGGELAELRAYVLAKLLWNPDYDVNVAIDEFLHGYYGKAAEPIRRYIDLLHRKVQDENIHVNIWAPPTASYLSPDLMAEAVKLFDEAETRADDEHVLHRVRTARLPILYVQISTLSKGDPARGLIIKEFFEIADQAGITQIKEGRPMEEYRKELKA